jgi:uncharacterized membrane protein (UPF0127 family)
LVRKKPSKLPNYIPIIVLFLVVAAIGTALAVGGDSKPKQKTTPQKSTAYSSECGVYRNDRTATLGGADFKTEVNKTKEEYEKGLGGRPCILADQAMLFAYTKPLQIGIWMKDMKFPIDIVWISSGKKVVGLEINVAPSTYPDKFVNKDQPAQYVLELKANRVKELNIDLGSPVSF